MNKRDAVMNLINSARPSGVVPAAFFLHFDPASQQGQPAIDKHMQFVRATGMDFVKIQYEQTPPAPASAPFRKAQDWLQAPRCSEDFFEPTIQVVKGLVKAARAEALVVLTVYSPFMWARQLAAPADLIEHMQEHPEAVKKGLEILTENVLTLLRACKRAGVDGFYVSTQGGERIWFKGSDLFHWPPGHSVRVVKDAELVLFSPEKEHTHVMNHMLKVMQG